MIFVIVAMGGLIAILSVLPSFDLGNFNWLAGLIWLVFIGYIFDCFGYFDTKNEREPWEYSS